MGSRNLREEQALWLHLRLRGTMEHLGETLFWIHQKELLSLALFFFF